MEKKIAKNVSSGAKKVESVEEEKAYEPQDVNSAKTAKKQSKKTAQPASKAQSKAKSARAREQAAADKRVADAKKKASKKEEKLMKRAKLKEKKIEKKAELKAKKAERKAARQERRAERIKARQDKRAALKEKRLQLKEERAARRELIRHESKTERRKRIAREKKERIALKRKRHEARDKARENRMKAREAARERRANAKKHKREQKTERRKNTRGIGGWIAAVVTLGVASLALATVVTAGAIRMNEMNDAVSGSYRSTLFEMVSVSEEMDDDLTKLRVSSGAEEQRQLLTDLIVNSALMESALERVPVDAATGTDISSFVNRTGAYARRLLSDVEQGKQLTQTQKNTIDYLTEVNSTLFKELNDIVMNMSEKDMRAFLNGKEGKMSDGFRQAGQDTHKKSDEAIDAPFLGKPNVGRNQLEDEEEISEERASELVDGYFSAYHVRDKRMTGKTQTHGTELYNFVMTDENGVEIYAEVAVKGGALMFFDTYETCTEKNFDMDASVGLAKEYLASIGIENVEATFLSDAGMVADITFVTVKDDVRLYSERIKIRVCESKGRVVGMDASAYFFNHEERTIAQPALSEREAMDKLSTSLAPYEAHLCYVARHGKDTLAYEFACYTETETYLVYIDANTGDEIAIYRIREGNGGKFIR